MKPKVIIHRDAIHPHKYHTPEDNRNSAYDWTAHEYFDLEDAPYCDECGKGTGESNGLPFVFYCKTSGDNLCEGCMTKFYDFKVIVCPYPDGYFPNENFKNYEKAAARTDIPRSLANAKIYHMLKLSGECGELANMIGKWNGQGHDLEEDKCLEEMGDILWHLSRLADSFGSTLQEVANLNIEKLKKRYPYGFDVFRSVNK